MNREHGFILVEIITILLIVGILVNVWLPNYFAIKKKAQAARIIGDFLVIRDAVTIYHSDYGEWPHSSQWGRCPAGLGMFMPSDFAWDLRPELGIRYSWEYLPLAGLEGGTEDGITGVSVFSDDDALLKANPDLAEHYGESDNIRERIRAVLGGQVGTAISGEQERLVKHIRASLAEHRARSGRAASFDVPDGPPGILTSMTRKLPPERAIELYRKITPIVVHQVLNRFNSSANVGVVQRVVDHLCSKEVHLRLRACEHVRDGILDELCTFLGRRAFRQEVSREDLQAVFEHCGVMDELIAMENCIKLAASKAS